MADQKRIPLAQKLTEEIDKNIANLRRIISEPVVIHYTDKVSIEIRPQGDDDRINVNCTGKGFTTVHYTDDGLIVDVFAEGSTDADEGVWLDNAELAGE